MSRALVAWAGLDFDTAEMDGEIRETLAAVAPPGGALQGVSMGAQVRVARDAAQEDAVALRVARAEADGCDLEDSTPTELAADAMVACLAALTDAQAALLASHEALMRARRLLGLA